MRRLEELLKERANVRPAMVKADNIMDYADLYEAAYSISKQINFTNTIILLLFSNSFELIVALFSVWFSKNTAILQWHDSTKEEIVEIIDRCNVSAIITDKRKGREIESVVGKKEINLFVLDPSMYLVSIISNKIKGMYIDKKIALILRTSGTTEKAKYVMLSHENIIFNISSNVKSLRITKMEKSLVVLPMVFCYCLIAQVLSHLFVGATVVIGKQNPAPQYVYYEIQQHKITNIMLASPLLSLMALYSRENGYNISSLRYIYFGAGAMSKDKLMMIMKRMPKVKFFHTYGLTEASPRVSTLEPEYAWSKMGSVGKPIKGVEVKIVDEKDTEVSAGEVGELLVKGKNVMVGYFEGKGVFSNMLVEWLRTGDYAKYDLDGFIYIVGRKKSMINVGGILVSPESIEEVIINYPDVEAVLVKGEKSSLYGEVPIAQIKLKKHSTLNFSLEDLQKYCASKLSRYKMPHKFIIVDQINFTLNGKKIRRS